jgi:DNA-binding NarL/FixJ family response regulator
MARHSTILLIVPDNDPATLHLADTTGAHGFITRSAEPDQLAIALNTLRSGGSYLSPNLLEHLTHHPHPATSTPGVLARREIETLRWLAHGLTHRQIARRMNLTEATISTYVKHIRAKLHAGNKAELTRKAIELGYLGISIPDHLAATA